MPVIWCSAAGTSRDWPDIHRGQIGPFIFPPQAAKVKTQLDDAVSRGATIHCGGVEDHGGMWCVEGVWSGRIEVVSYRLLEEQTDRARFQNVGTIVAGSGSAGSLIPPHEYHTIANPDPEKIAVSVHVYSKAMDACNFYLPGDDGWHRKEPRILELDAA